MAQLLFLKKGQFSTDDFISKLPHLPLLNEAKENRIRHLFDHTCFDLTIANVPSKASLVEIRNSIAPHQIDVLCFDSYIDKTKPNLFSFDMDSTVIQEEVIDELARKHGVFEEVSKVTKQAMEGGLGFDEALKLRVKHLKGLSRESFEAVHDLLHLNPGMEVILRELPHHNAFIAILSGGFTPILELFAKKYRIDFFKANELEERDAHFTGEILGEIINKEKKAYYLNQIASERSIAKGQVVAVGDGANDGLMLQTAEIGIGFHAKQGLKDQIYNWIDFCDMSVLLFLFRPSI
jgi:phosphoserine phosphatase